MEQRAPSSVQSAVPGRLLSRALCALLLLLIPACQEQPGAALQRERELSRRNWTPPPQVLAQPAAASSNRCISCHVFAAETRRPGRREFIAALSPEQQLLVAAAGESTAPPASGPPDQGSAGEAMSHPGAWLSWHPPQRFGCVSCHSGSAAGLSLGSSGHPASLELEASLARAGDPAAALAAAPERRLGAIRSGAAVYASCGACHPGDYVPGAELLQQGRQLIRELGCSACHELSPQLQASLPPGRSRRGPSLARVGEKLGLATLSEWPNHTHDYAPAGGSHGMPQYRLSETQSRALAVYLKADSPAYGEEYDPLLGTPKGPGPPPRLQPDNPQRGLELVRQGRCVNCHSLPLDQLPASDLLRSLPSSNIGPNLEHIGARLASEWIESFLADPAAHYPGTRMPRYLLTPQDRGDIAAWLVLASSDNSPRAFSQALPDWFRELDAASRAGLRAQGRALFLEQGCAGCHQSAETWLQARRIGPSLLRIGAKSALNLPPAATGALQEGRLQGLADYFSALLAEPWTYGAAGPGQGRMPHFELSESERQAIAVALLAETAEAVAPAQHLELRPRAAMPAHQSSDRLFADPLHSDYWPWPLPAQGRGPAAQQDGGHGWLSSAERGLAPQDCGSCHREQYSQWQGSRHARAMSPGVTGQLIEWLDGREDEFYDCLRCHARLSEQLLLRRAAAGRRDPGAGKAGSAAAAGAVWEANPDFQPALQASAHGCANCHLRSQVRLGSSRGRTLYLWDSQTISRHALQREDWLSDSRLCAACHQFELNQRVSSGGPPLENTYEEWRAWAATQSRPKSCQDCHMPAGDHSFRGIHDPDFVRRNATVRAEHSVQAGRLRARLTLVNSNNGHHLPTYVTPRIWLQGFFLDAAGRRIDASFRDAQVGRDADSRRNSEGQIEWFDRSDTRIPAGASFSFDYDEALPAAARSFQLEIFVEPDHFYYHAYGRWLKQDQRSAAGRALLQAARGETDPQRSGYYLYQQSFPLAPH